MRNIEMPPFDLSGVIAQLANESSCKTWTPEMFQDAESEYRQFLAISKAYPDQAIMPTELGDVVWHRHILNTEQYMADCNAFFGHYLHHNPGMPSGAVVEESGRLFDKHFGVTTAASPTTCSKRPTVTCSKRSVATCSKRAKVTCSKQPAAA